QHAAGVNQELFLFGPAPGDVLAGQMHDGVEAFQLCGVDGAGDRVPRDAPDRRGAFRADERVDLMAGALQRLRHGRTHESAGARDEYFHEVGNRTLSKLRLANVPDRARTYCHGNSTTSAERGNRAS